MRLSIIINICFIFSIPLLAQIQYSDVALQIGIDHQYLQGGPGGGVSFVDFDGDGWDDITLATAVGDSILFFKNLKIFNNRIDALEHEIELHKMYDVGNNSMFYNLQTQTSSGIDFTGKTHTESSKIKIEGLFINALAIATRCF